MKILTILTAIIIILLGSHFILTALVDAGHEDIAIYGGCIIAVIAALILDRDGRCSGR